MLVLSQEYTGLPDNSVGAPKNERIKGISDGGDPLSSVRPKVAYAPRWIAADTFGQLRELGVIFDGGRLGRWHAT